jgi:hypothetical protein
MTGATKRWRWAIRRLLLQVAWDMENRKKSMAAKVRKKARRVRLAPFITITIFLIIGILGIMTGEVRRVLEQAVQVCLSCIGIG